MTQLIHEPDRIAKPAPRAGLVFVPCAICLKPVDLAVIAEHDVAQLCESHRVADYLPAD
jgi:hypothetical protein